MTQDQITAIQVRIDNRNSQIKQLTAENEIDTEVLGLATTGYQSDQTAIGQAVSDKVLAALAPVQTAISAALPVLSTAVTPQ